MGLVICINDKGRPNEIPMNKWVKEGNEYTVLEAIKCNPQGGILGFKLAEIDLTGCEPYLYFAASRFRIPVPEKTHEEELAELIDL